MSGRSAVSIRTKMGTAMHPQCIEYLKWVVSLKEPLWFNGATPAEIRAARRARPPLQAEDVHKVEDLKADNVPVRVYWPTKSETPLPALLWYHGGGWVLGDLDAYDSCCRTLANAANVVVVSVDYRLGPEHRFPAAVDDSLAAAKWVHANAQLLGIRADCIAVGGDSAGGNLASVVAQQRPIPIVYQLLVYPGTDMRMLTNSMKKYAEGYGLTAKMCGWFIDHYLGVGASKIDPRASPMLADRPVFLGLPPACVIMAECDILRDECEQYVNLLRAADVPVTTKCYEGMIHAFFTATHKIDAAREAQLFAAAQLKSAVHSRST